VQSRYEAPTSCSTGFLHALVDLHSIDVNQAKLTLNQTAQSPAVYQPITRCIYHLLTSLSFVGDLCVDFWRLGATDLTCTCTNCLALHLSVFNPAWSAVVIRPAPCAYDPQVFKTTLTEFKERQQFLQGDRRFEARVGRQSARKLVKLWAEKEMANLIRMHRAGIRCPRVVLNRKHLLVMTLIGSDGRPAPKLKVRALTSGWMLGGDEEG